MRTLGQIIKWCLVAFVVGSLVFTLDQIGVVNLQTIPYFRKTPEQAAKLHEEQARIVVDARGRFCMAAGIWRDSYRESQLVQELVGWTIKNRAAVTKRDVCDVFGFGETMVPIGYVRSKSYSATPEFVRSEAWSRSWYRPGFWSTFKAAEVLAVKIAALNYQPPRPEVACAVAYIRRDRLTWTEEENALKALRDPAQYRRVLTLEEVEFFCPA